MTAVLIFLIALLAYYTFGIRYQSFILTVLSLYMYWQVAEWSIIIIGAVSLVSVFFCQLLTIHKKRIYIVLPILCILTVFILLRDRITGWGLPIGFSVLSFTSISLLVDQYRCPQKYKTFDVLSYLLFFPKIFAGPIERASQFITESGIRFNGMGFYTGIKYLIFATFIKFVMGDWFGSTEMSAYGFNQTANILVFAIVFFLISGDIHSWLLVSESCSGIISP